MIMRAIALLAVTTILLTVGAGCESDKFTRERYETIYTGQSAEAVQAILGEPDVKFDNSWRYMRSRPVRKAIIEFDADGTVTRKAWYDRDEMGDHPESLDEIGAPSIRSSGSSSVTIDD